MNDLNLSGPEQLCKELSRTFAGELNWKWDDRFQTILAEFNVDNKTRVRDILVRRLDRVWDSSTIRKGPAVVQTIIGALGGIMPDQLLFTSDPHRDPLVFCAWWPWGDEKTISIRLASHYQAPSDPDRAEEIQRLKEWLAIDSNT